MENFLVDTKRAGEQVSKQVDFSSQTDTFHSFGYIVTSITYVVLVLFILGKCLLDSYQLFLIYIDVWLYNSHVSR